MTLPSFTTLLKRLIHTKTSSQRGLWTRTSTASSWLPATTMGPMAAEWSRTHGCLVYSRCMFCRAGVLPTLSTFPRSATATGAHSAGGWLARLGASSWTCRRSETSTTQRSSSTFTTACRRTRQLTASSAQWSSTWTRAPCLCGSTTPAEFALAAIFNALSSTIFNIFSFQILSRK